MAAVDRLRIQLKSDQPIADPFGLLGTIAALTSQHGQTSELRELVVRALSRGTDFASAKPLLMSLARDFGLFPYLEAEELPLADLLAREIHRPDGLDNLVFHSMQGRVYRELMAGGNIILSAPTSFGKSLIVDALIASGKYDNVVVIVPTIALIDETRRRMTAKFQSFKIFTHPGQAYADRNIFVLTQERYLALKEPPRPDLFFVDEFYKLDERSTNERLSGRAALLNQALYRLMKTGAQFYLAGPSIEEISSLVPLNVKRTLLATDFSTVAANLIRLRAVNDDGRKALLQSMVPAAVDPTLIYCRSPKRVRDVVGWLSETRETRYGAGMPELADWLEKEYGMSWSLPAALRLGIGTHHGRLPRWLANKIVEGFNAGQLGVLVCNNTLIEGVNTTAKNVFILDRTLARRAYGFFTFMNIKGRGGRMFKHFVGNIYLFHDPPANELPSVDIPGISQSETAPTGLLLSIDENDRTEKTNLRLGHILNQDVLSVNTIRSNKGVAPEGQIALAEHLMRMTPSALRRLQWNTAYPTYNELEVLMELIWEYIPPEGVSGHGATSAAQLTFFTVSVSMAEGDAREVMQKFTQPSEWDQGKSIDDKVDACFDFMRFWIDHNLPTLIRAVDRIGAEVLTRRGLVPGRYGSFVSRVEDGFVPHLLMTLEEFGLPVQISKKLIRHIGAYETLDDLLSAISTLNPVALQDLDTFERGMVLDAIRGIDPGAALLDMTST